jgi:hypothetical protein
MAGFTNKGKYTMLGWMKGTALPTNFYVALVTSATAPVADTNTKSELTELTEQFGYTTGGKSLTKNGTDFPVHTEDDGADTAYIRIKDQAWTASGGSIGAARYAILTDDNATQGSRLVLAFWSLTSDRTVSDGQVLTLQALELQLTE